MPVEVDGVDGARGSADVRPEREQRVETAKEVDVPVGSVRDRDLCEARITVDERGVRNSGVLVAPEPATARKVEEEGGVGAHATPLRFGHAVKRSLVVDVAPAIAEFVPLERARNRPQRV